MNFYAYYSKGYVYFDKEKIGYCKQEEKIIKNDGTCGKWSGNTWRRAIPKRISIKKLSELINSLFELTQILKEEGAHSRDMIIPEKMEVRIIKEYEVHDITESDE